MDWLLLGVFAFMSLTIVARADLKTDLLIVFVGMCGGLAIESWGTQTNLWHYYTAERPPLVDHPRLADCKSIDRPDHQAAGLDHQADDQITAARRPLPPFSPRSTG